MWAPHTVPLSRLHDLPAVQFQNGMDHTPIQGDITTSSLLLDTRTPGPKCPASSRQRYTEETQTTILSKEMIIYRNTLSNFDHTYIHD